MINKRIAIIFVCLLLIVSPLVLPTFAEQTDEAKEALELMQKGLTIYEIDRELERLNEQDAKIAAQIDQTQSEIEGQHLKVQETRKHAGKVLRAYYTGERDSIWLLLFTVNSFTDALKMLEYLNMIMNNDQIALARYTESFQQLKALKEELEQSRVKLQETKRKFVKQRERLVALQEELDRQIAASAQAKVVEQQIKSLNDEWKHKGLPIFREYFEQLSIAFKALPELVMKSNGKNLGANGFTLTDTELNEFLISKNDLFQSLTFKFTGDKVVASGHKDGQNIVIEGSFMIIEGTNNEVRYQVNQLTFNNFQLPDTTIESLVDEFKLGFYPRLATNGWIEVSQITKEEGKLIIKLKFTF